MNQKNAECVVLVLHYIHGHLDKPLTIKSLCSVAAMSRTVFLHSFKSVTGLTPARYISEVRIGKACSLLLTTEKSLSQIANETGFYDKSHLSHVFKNKYGLTPHAFLKCVYSYHSTQKVLPKGEA